MHLLLLASYAPSLINFRGPLVRDVLAAGHRVCLAAPAMLYGITHNGVRFTIFWLLFAASMAMARNSEIAQVRRAAPSSSPRPTPRVVS